MNTQLACRVDQKMAITAGETGFPATVPTVPKYTISLGYTRSHQPSTAIKSTSNHQKLKNLKVSVQKGHMFTV